MKIAILSDIHGNLPALERVAADVDAWDPDVTVVNGDTVNRGPDSRACWQFVQERAEWQVLMGNHETYVIQWLNSQLPSDAWEKAWARVSHWTYGQLNGQAASLVDLPQQAEIEGPDGRPVRITHASVGDLFQGIYPDTPAAEIRQRIGPAPAVFVTGHTHLPLVRRVDETLVVNTGATGVSFDGDPRASYARLRWERGGWRAEIVRLPYDRDRVEHSYRESGFLESAHPAVDLLFYEWFHAQSLIPQWFRRYETAIKSGHVDMATAIHQFLDEEGLPKRL